MDRGARVVIVERNLGNSRDEAYVECMSRHGYRPIRVPQEQDPVPVIDREAPLAACFQYDRPDLPGLAKLGLAKKHVPGIPLIMITRAHSEALAVWAFRTRVWDYFVQPVDLDRFLGVLAALAAVRAEADRRRAPSRQALSLPNPIPPEARLPGSPHPERCGKLELARSYVEQNLHRKIAQAKAAELCGLSPFQFSRTFKRAYAVTFQEYVLRRRITEAMRLLAHPGVSVTDVCFSVGFHDLSYFTRMFQRYAGVTPSHFRLAMPDPGRTAAESVVVTQEPPQLGLELRPPARNRPAAPPKSQDEDPP